LAEAPAPLAPTWSGAFFGIDGGYGWGSAKQTAGVGSAAFVPPFSTLGGMPGTAVSGTISGGVFGGHAGYNFQYGNFVLGAESSIQWTSLKGTQTAALTFPGIAGTPTESYNTRLKWLETSTARAGIAFGNILLYAKGGLAVGNIDVSTTRLTGASAGTSFGANLDRVGFTVGGGIDYQWTPNWIIGIEGNYVNFGHTVNYAGFGAPGGNFASENVSQTFGDILGSISYKF
jgi:outer membrane immunogenic protein